MAKKPSRTYVCTNCGAVHAKWAGQCDACGEWNTLEEMAVEPLAASSAAVRGGKGRRVALQALEGEIKLPPRTQTGIAELDRVLGGGLVPASVVLVGGDPGIGKSTLLLQAASKLAGKGERVLYISGEEAVDQIRLRAQRLGVAGAKLDLAASINVADIVATLEAEPDVRAVVIDSIQTMWLETIDSAPGTVSQVRACAFELIRTAKRRGFSLILVGHVTKEGALAGPRVLEHMVDAVMYFEGDRGHQFRILRAAKNRYGATDEIGVFAMTDRGLEEVSNPSALFLAERRGNIAGSAVFAGLEGTRPVLLEVQALLAPKSGDGAPRRAVVGWDTGRLSMLLAVLETRCGLKLSGMDVYLNVAGGLKVAEPAADLAVAAALVSAASGVPTSPGEVYFGEVGLSGEVRQVAQADARLKEAAKLGFDRAVLPRRIARGNTRSRPPEGLHLREIGHISDLVSAEMEAE
ncbi:MULTISPECIES: DNA repair protein RadA [Acetobacter]|uniref:DNA repair protein RadA n=2 Tax=Acetobacter TaxID=434 RepID=A0AAN1PIP6_9PROT|nr:MULTISPECIES: DNA repair protein RadA [Acetobacter]ASL39666.1 DNA repair protein RadA [Acetobacter oryzifermentans]AXN00905.1 DNA repair protein RadA [Acetobacter pomorum]KAA8395847.1 DNA repair protein RadA [Acetobacter sp. DmW_125124]KAA8398524.1 DNA repair protein RadA [Acetobacter sp. DmW_125127]KAA8399058.1 DNA repair protein RadA [Acetobacter sp. DmW_125128]